MALRPHAGVRYRFRKESTAEWEEAAWSNYVEAETDEAVLKELQARNVGCQIELLEVRFKQM